MPRRLAPVLFAGILAGLFASFVSCATVNRERKPEGLDGGVPADAGAAQVESGPHKLGDCHPTPGATGNALHVGAYCTQGGGQCKAYPEGTATSCATDLSDKGGDFCIYVGCSSHKECGEGACCHGNPFVKACVPVGCLSDAGVCPE